MKFTTTLGHMAHGELSFMPIDGVVDISAEHVEKFDVFIRAGLLVPVVDVPVVDDSGEPTRGAQRAARGKRRMESEGRMERERRMEREGRMESEGRMEREGREEREGRNG